MRLKRVVVGLVAGSLTAAALMVPPASAAPTKVLPQAGDALTPWVSVPRATMRDSVIIAASGSRLVRSAEIDDETVFDYSLDNGKSWRAVPAGLLKSRPTPSGRHSIAGVKGVFYVVESEFSDPCGGWCPWEDDCDPGTITGFKVWNPGTGTVRHVGVKAPMKHSICNQILSVGKDRVATLSGHTFDLSGVNAKEIKSFAGPEGGVQLSEDGKTAAISPSYNDFSYVKIVSGGGAKSRKVKLANGATAPMVSGAELHYLVATSKKLAICRVKLKSPTKSNCRTLRTKDSRGPGWYLQVSHGIEVVTHFSGSAQTIDSVWLVRGSRVKRLPTGAGVSYEVTDSRDPAKPLVMRATPTAKVYGRVSTTLAVDWSMPCRKVPAPGDFVLTPNRLVLSDARPYDADPRGTIWQRSFGAAGAGAEEQLARPKQARQVTASGLRTVVGESDYGIQVYDGKKRVPFEWLGWVNGISGPYLATQEWARRLDGSQKMDTAQESTVFGSLVAAIPAAGEAVTIRDLALPAAAPITVPLPSNSTCSLAGLWGDWVSADCGGASASESCADAAVAECRHSVIVNYRTKQSYGIDGAVVGLGDGYAVVRTEPVSANAPEKVVNFVTGQSFGLPGSYKRGVRIDGVGQVAWDTRTSIEIAKVPGVGRSAPRFLGALAAASFKAGASWQMSLDATKPLNAGELVVTNPAGVAVRTIPTVATASGSLRGVSWDGRDSAGHLLPAGAYTWTWTASAADGTGALVDVTGLQAATGTVTVT